MLRPMPRTLHLIKHGRPAAHPGARAHDWDLAPGALDTIPALAARLGPVPALVVTSEERKARATGEALAARLNVPVRAMLGLHEHLRYTVPWGSQEEFEASCHAFFRHPSELVLGEETADEAHVRFRNAISAVMGANGGDVAVVAHGTVISLLVARAGGLDPVPMWQALDFCGVLRVTWPDLRLI